MNFNTFKHVVEANLHVGIYNNYEDLYRWVTFTLRSLDWLIDLVSWVCVRTIDWLIDWHPSSRLNDLINRLVVLLFLLQSFWRILPRPRQLHHLRCLSRRSLRRESVHAPRRRPGGTALPFHVPLLWHRRGSHVECRGIQTSSPWSPKCSGTPGGRGGRGNGIPGRLHRVWHTGRYGIEYSTG